MVKEGDIVLADIPRIKGAGRAVAHALVIGRSYSTGSVVASYITADIKAHASKRFTEGISQSDLEDGTLKEDVAVLIDTVVTLNPSKIKKIATLKKKKLDRVLRVFSRYAGYCYYKNMSMSGEGRCIPASGKALDEKELFNMMDASLDMWLTSGRFNDEFEKKFAEFLGVKFALTVNSGSSANLLALSALISHKLGSRRLKKGDEVITVAAAFPTTVTPIVQNNLIPVFIDIEPGTYNIDVSQIEDAISEKTKAIFVAHTLGNPFRVDDVLKICKKHKLFLIEDCCDALGSRYTGRISSTAGYTGTFGDIATFSFYPAHHMTMGEGGAVVTGNPRLNRIILSLRDWGRDCWCPTGKDNTCGKRFSQQQGKLPFGYDHKYVYSHSGYNVKITDWQAAIGLAQLRKLPRFLKKRKENFKLLYEGLEQFKKYFILPRATENSEAAWFGFPITLKKDSVFDRNRIVEILEKKGVGTRLLFAGNMLRQPVFLRSEIRMRIRNSGILLSNRLTGKDYELIPNTDTIMNKTFWIGIWPGIGRDEIKYIIETFENFFSV